MKREKEALISGVCIGAFAVSFIATLIANHVLTKFAHIGHGAGMLGMGATLALYLAINYHRLRWLPVAIIALFLLGVGEWG